MRPAPFLVAAAAVVCAACADLPTQPDTGSSAPPRLEEVAPAHPQLLVCPTSWTQTARETIGPEGGKIGVAGSSITIPPGAVPSPTEFEVVVPASPYMEVEIHPVGMDSYLFAVPATVKISYARCPADAMPTDAALQGVYIDGATNRVLERMGGDADKVSRKLSFHTWHLSGYAIAF
jgi:hypothetical protein